jgi:hypothetical protein
MYVQSRQIFAMTMVALALLLTPAIIGTAFAKVVEPNTKVRAIQDGNSLDESIPGQLGFDTDCVAGIQGSGIVDEVVCYLVPDGIPTPDYVTTAITPQSSTTEESCPGGVGFTGGFVCFTTTFDSGLLSPGHWRFVAEYYNDGQLVDVKGSNVWTNHSFFVLPESAIGIIALVASSLAVLGGFVFLRGRSRPQTTI